MHIRNLVLAISCISALSACQTNTPLAAAHPPFSNDCPHPSTTASEAPRVLKDTTADENIHLYTVSFGRRCSYTFLALSSSLWSFEEFDSFYWNADPFLAYPQTRAFWDTIETDDTKTTDTLYLFSTLGANNTRSVVFQGSAIVVNERQNLSFLK